MREHVEPLRKPNTINDYRRSIDRHIRPRLGRLILRDISRADVAALRVALRKTPIAANKALAVFSSLWSYSANVGEVEENLNPARGAQRYREQPRERFLTADELARLGEALRVGETVGLPYAIDEGKATAKHANKPESRLVKIDPFAAAAIRLLLLTGARLREFSTRDGRKWILGAASSFWRTLKQALSGYI